MKRAIVLATLLPSAALAHQGDHASLGLVHYLTSPDHLAMIAVAAAVIYGLVELWARR